MKTMALEFMLSWDAIVSVGLPARQGVSPDGGVHSVRCRLIVNEITDTQVFWRDRNELGEEVWRGGHGYSGPSLLFNHLWVEQATIISYGLCRLASMLVGSPSLATLATRELPNGAIVFDLGTV